MRKKITESATGTQQENSIIKNEVKKVMEETKRKVSESTVQLECCGEETLKKMECIQEITADLLKNLAERKLEEMTVDLGLGFLLNYNPYEENLRIKLPYPVEIDGEISEEVEIETAYYRTDNHPYDIIWEDVAEEVNLHIEDICRQMFHRCLRVRRDFVIDGIESEFKSEQGVVHKATKFLIRDLISMERDCCIELGVGVKLCTFSDNYDNDFKIVLKFPCDEVAFYSEDYYSPTHYDFIRLGCLSYDINCAIFEYLESRYDVTDMGNAWINS